MIGRRITIQNDRNKMFLKLIYAAERDLFTVKYQSIKFVIPSSQHLNLYDLEHFTGNARLLFVCNNHF